MCNVVYVIYCIADPEGMANAQKSLGIGQEEKAATFVEKERKKKGKMKEGWLGGVGGLDLKGS